MPVVTNTIKRPDGTAYAAGRVVIELAGENGRPLPIGHVTANDYSIESAFTIETLTAGVWSQNLVANTLINPTGTAWRITEQVDGRNAVYYVTVPDGAGPYFVEDILTDAPSSVASAALTAHMADATAHAGAVRGDGGVLGAELLTFTSLTGWTGANWTWDGGAEHTAGSTAPLVSDTVTATKGTTYLVSMTDSGATAGSVRAFFGGSHVAAGDSLYVTATDDGAFRLIPTSNYDGTVTAVSVKVVTTDDTYRVDDPVTFTKTVTMHSRIDVPDGHPISIGYLALDNNSEGEYNVASSNTAVGYQAGMETTSGHVTAFGYRAAEANTDGVCTAFGKWAGLANTSGHSSMFGNAAGRSNTTGSIDAFGDESAALNTTGSIAAFGYYAGHNNVTGIVTAIGYQAGRYQGSAATYTAVGYNAAQRATTGQVTGVGYQAAQLATTGHVTALGHAAATVATTGTVTAVGVLSAGAVTTGSIIAIGYRAAVGAGSANASVTDAGSIFIGDYTDRTVVSATVVSYGVALGYQAQIGALRAIAIGRDADAVHQDSIALGANTLTTATDQVMVGARDIEITDTAKGLVIKSPDGTRYRVQVANGGALSAVAA